MEEKIFMTFVAAIVQRRNIQFNIFGGILMKVKGKMKLDEIADRLWTKEEMNLKPCEKAYVIGEMAKRLALEMLQSANDKEN